MLVSTLRPVIAAAAIGFAVLGVPQSALADDVTKGKVVTVSHAKGFNISYFYGKAGNREAKDYSVGLMGIKFNEDKSKLAYCIDIHNPLAQNATYKESSWESAAVGNLQHVNWILHNSFPSKTAGEVLTKAGIPTESEPAYLDGGTVKKNQYLVYAGTQAAIWHFSDGFSLMGDAQKDGFGAEEFATVKKVYDYLVRIGEDTPAHPTVGITPKTSTARAGDKAGPFTVSSSVGDVTLEVANGTAIDKDGNKVTKIGDKEKFWLTSNSEGTVNVTATGKGNTDIGRVFVFDSWPERDRNAESAQGKQKVILPGTKTETVTAKVSGTFTAAPILPVTGTATVGIAAAGVLLLGAGAGLVLMRRKRLRFEA